jgi:4-carboxymuconolactone decarboxylase
VTQFPDSAARQAEITGQPQRIASLDLDEFGPESWDLAKRIRDAAKVESLSLPGVFRLMLRHPDLFRCQIEMGIQLMGKGALPPIERELAVLRTGWLCGAPYEWGEHVDIGKRYGMDPAWPERVTHGPDHPDWTPHQAAILRAVDELLDIKMISDATWAVLAQSWNEQQLIEFPTLVGQYVATAFFQNSLRVRLAQDNPGLCHR